MSSKKPAKPLELELPLRPEDWCADHPEALKTPVATLTVILPDKRKINLLVPKPPPRTYYSEGLQATRDRDLPQSEAIPLVRAALEQLPLTWVGIGSPPYLLVLWNQQVVEERATLVASISEDADEEKVKSARYDERYAWIVMYILGLQFRTMHPADYYQASKSVTAHKLPVGWERWIAEKSTWHRLRDAPRIFKRHWRPYMKIEDALGFQPCDKPDCPCPKSSPSERACLCQCNDSLTQWRKMDLRVKAVELGRSDPTPLLQPATEAWVSQRMGPHTTLKLRQLAPNHEAGDKLYRLVSNRINEPKRKPKHIDIYGVIVPRPVRVNKAGHLGWRVFKDLEFPNKVGTLSDTLQRKLQAAVRAR